MHEELGRGPDEASEPSDPFGLAPLQVLLPAVTGIALLSWLGLLWALLPGIESRALDALAGHGAALLLIFVQALLGRALLSLLRLERLLDGVVESFLFAWTAGFVLSAALFMALALVDSLNAVTVSALGAVVLLASGRWVAARSRIYAGITRELWRTPDRKAGLSWAFALVLVCLWALPIVLQTGLPNTDWDSALYHLPLADRYLAGQLWNADPLFSAYSFPGDASLSYAALLSIGFESAIVPFNFWGFVMAWAGAGVLATRLAGPRAGAWGALVFASTHVFWQQAVDPRIDALLTLFVLLGISALTNLVRAQEPKHLALVAIAANAAMGVKYTGLVYGLGVLGVGALFAMWQLRAKGLRDILSLAALCLPLLLVPGALPYASNLALHQDPFFPMLRGDYFLDDAGERVYVSGDLELPGARIDPEIRRTERQLSQLGAKNEAPTHLFDYLDILRNPDDYAVKPNHFATPLAILFLFLPLFLPARGPSRSATWVFYGLGLGLYLLFAPLTNLTRYVLPVLGILSTGAGIVIAALPSRILQAIFAAVLALVLLRNAAFEWDKTQLLQPASYFAGEVDRLEWLERVGFNFTPAMATATRELNRMIPAESGGAIFMVGEGKGRLLENPYLPDSTWYMQRWLAEVLNAQARGPRERGGVDYSAIARSLRSQGVSHLLINRGYFDWVVRNTDANLGQVAFGLVHLRRFSKRHGRIIYDRDGIQVLELVPAP